MAITITRPQAYQVYKRSGGLADITISGTYTGTPTSIQASWNGGAYQTIVASPAGGVYSGTLPAQPSGQGALTVRFSNDVAQNASVNFVGVGDVYLVIGQSNAAGSGVAMQSYTHATLKAAMWKIGASAWQEMADPTHISGGSCWPLLATLYMAGASAPFAIIGCGVGSTSLVVAGKEWQKGNSAYNQALATLTASGVNGVTAILMLQGEGDANLGASQVAYQTALSQMLDDMQADLSLLHGVKLIAGQIDDFAGAARANIDAVRSAQAYCWDIDPDILAGPVLGDIDLSDGDGIHFGRGADGQYEQQTLANRWWRMLRHHILGHPEGRGYRFGSAVATGPVVSVRLSGGVAPLAGQSDTRGWRVTDGGVAVSIVSASADGAEQVKLTLATDGSPLGAAAGPLRVSFGSGTDARNTTLMDAGAYPLPPEPFVDKWVTPALAESISGFGFYIDVENGAGVRQGSGPIASALRFRSISRMDKAGAFSFEMPASDPKAALIRKKYVVRAYAILRGVRVEVGAGIIDDIQRSPQADGDVMLVVSGDDLTRELTYRSVLNLKLYSGGNPVSHAAAVAAVAGFAPPGWTISPDPAPPSNSVYGYFNGETVLQALIKTADKSQSHFTRGVGRTLSFASSFADSGQRAIKASGDLAQGACAITKLTEITNTYDLITRIYPRGSGNSNVELTLRATTRTAPPGFVLDKVNNYIENSAASAEFGRIERRIDFKEIGPIDNTSADITAASNALFDAAIEDLRRRSDEMVEPIYEVELAGCDVLLRALQSLWVNYRNMREGLVLNTRLNILEATWDVSAAGLYTSAIKVSSADRWPRSAAGTLADSMEQGHLYQALQQLNANSYVTAYRANVDSANMATCRFRFGGEVTQLQQVFFEFQVLAFESTVRAVGGATSGSGALPTGVPSDNTTSSAGNNDSGPGGAGNSGATTVNTATTSLDTATTGLGTATSALNTATAGLNTATSSLSTATSSLSTATSALGTATSALNTATAGLSTATTSLNTGSPTGGDTISAGQHQHNILITLGGTVLNPVGYGAAGTPGGLVSNLAGSSHNYATNASGNHTHSISAHTHTVADHSHTLAAHSHTLADHSHTLAAHSHTVADHSHTLAAHSHTLAAHSHTLADHSHTIPNHSHTLASHSHTTAAHTHTMSNHTHSLNNHTHSLADSLTAVYGIFRETAIQTYLVDDLEYNINGGGWLTAASATDVGSGWRRLDITSAVMDPNTFRPVHEANTIQMRASATAGQITLINGWSISADSGQISFSSTAVHGLTAGDKVAIAGASIGLTNGSNVNGIYTVVAVDDLFTFRVGTAIVVADTAGAGGTLAYARTGTIDAQLSVFNIIQAIALV